MIEWSEDITAGRSKNYNYSLSGYVNNTLRIWIEICSHEPRNWYDEGTTYDVLCEFWNDQFWRKVDIGFPIRYKMYDEAVNAVKALKDHPNVQNCLIKAML